MMETNMTGVPATKSIDGSFSPPIGKWNDHVSTLRGVEQGVCSGYLLSPRITLHRTWANLGALKRATVLVGLFASAFGGDELDEEQVEALKKREHIADLMSELGKKFPDVKVPLIDERDQYLISHVEAAVGKTVLAVVGAGHIEGMLKNLGKDIDRAALEVFPKTRAVEWLRAFMPIVLGAVAAALAFVRHVPPAALLFAWCLPIVSFLLLFLFAARARAETCLVGAVTAPLLACTAAPEKCTQ